MNKNLLKLASSQMKAGAFNDLNLRTTNVKLGDRF